MKLILDSNFGPCETLYTARYVQDAEHIVITISGTKHILIAYEFIYYFENYGARISIGALKDIPCMLVSHKACINRLELTMQQVRAVGWGTPSNKEFKSIFLPTEGLNKEETDDKY